MTNMAFLKKQQQIPMCSPTQNKQFINCAQVLCWFSVNRSMIFSSKCGVW